MATRAVALGCLAAVWLAGGVAGAGESPGIETGRSPQLAQSGPGGKRREVQQKLKEERREKAEDARKRRAAEMRRKKNEEARKRRQAENARKRRAAKRQEADRADCDRGSSDASIAACTRLIESGRLNRNDLADAYIKRGNAYSNAGQRSRAFADYTRASEL